MDQNEVRAASAYVAEQNLQDIRVLRLHAAIASVLPYIEVPHVRATLQHAIEKTSDIQLTEN